MAFFCFLHPSLNDVSSKEHFWDTQLWIAISSFSINLLPSMMTIKFCVIKSFLMRFQSHVINVQFDEYWQSILSHFFFLQTIAKFWIDGILSCVSISITVSMLQHAILTYVCTRLIQQLMNHVGRKWKLMNGGGERSHCKSINLLDSFTYFYSLATRATDDNWILYSFIHDGSVGVERVILMDWRRENFWCMKILLCKIRPNGPAWWSWKVLKSLFWLV